MDEHDLARLGVVQPQLGLAGEPVDQEVVDEQLATRTDRDRGAWSGLSRPAHAAGRMSKRRPRRSSSGTREGTWRRLVVDRTDADIGGLLRSTVTAELDGFHGLLFLDGLEPVAHVRPVESAPDRGRVRGG